jgi:acyl-CoA synthetase (AMP-forming)/AMP-acid ligase II
VIGCAGFDFAGHSKSQQTQVHPDIIRNLLHGGDPSHAAINTLGQVLNYGELAHQVDDLAAQLTDLGLGKGDRIAMALPNGLEVIASFLAASTVGTAAPLNPSYTRDEFTFYLADTGARALILPKDNSADARAAANDGEILIIDSSIDESGHVRFTANGRLNRSNAAVTENEDSALILQRRLAMSPTLIN